MSTHTEPVEPAEEFSLKHFSDKDGTLLYKDVAVFATVQDSRQQLLVGTGGRLYVAAADHALKCWVQKPGGGDATAQQVFGVIADEQSGGYTALRAEGVSSWEHSYGGDLTKPLGLIQAISKSDAFTSVTWGAPYCTAGWVASLMPTLSSLGTVKIPGATVVIGQNVHSSTIVGSLWVKGLVSSDCRQEDFPTEWMAGVVSTLCPRATGHGDLANITLFCGLLKKAGFKPARKADLAARIRFILTNYPQHEKTLRALPNIQTYYSSLF
ncbi:hypothetical protein [Streptomyces sp. NBC_00083]|uniref:hypothetical protein n=1 Tax=Streptomyces sp. NBC_00083 TaxID=2975647 RepID=UPI0022570AA6|nr:hypothetical protein [Streptomyces sp. NBC_00083]MCX5384148.1 hypothetical protein [Streptomyces sp. NBC_00083]